MPEPIFPVHPPSPWDSWNPASCMPDGCFCEAPRGAWIRQPADTWSNLAYVVVGIFILRSLYPARRPYAWTLIFLGITSFAFHASLTLFWEWFDVSSMYMLVALLIFDSLRRIFSWSPAALVPCSLTLTGLMAVVVAFWPVWRREIFMVQAAVGAICELWAMKAAPLAAHRLFFAGLAVFLVSYGIWILDNNRILCSPHSWFQGHAVWHLLCAVAAWFWFRHHHPDPEAA